MTNISIIACIAKGNRAIGYKNRLLYHIPEDMARFRELTTGHTIIMGRKTFESLPNGALPNRRNIVISRQEIRLEGCEVYHSTEEALAQCQEDMVFVIGGGCIYRELIHQANRLYLTIVDEVAPKSDTFFPKFKPEEWKICYHSENKEARITKNHTINYSFYIYKKE